MQEHGILVSRRVHLVTACFVSTIWLLPVSVSAETPSVEQLLRLTPTQRNVEIDSPTATEVPKCSMAAKKLAGQTGWAVKSSAGVPLRWFVDTNGDNSVDQWSYYKDGLVVYRDIDSNFNGKVDHCRWFHSAGSRWGVDNNEDGKIDAWKMISAEEVTEEVIVALATRDAQRLSRLALTPSDLGVLGAGKAKTEQTAKKLQRLATDLKNVIASQKTISQNAKWIQFAAKQPGIVPAGTNGSTKDIEVYGSVIAIVEDSGQHVQVQIGELLRIGQGWRIIDVPKVLEEGQAELAPSGLFLQASMSSSPSTPSAGPSERFQELLGDLEELDKAAGEVVAPEEQARVSARRADLLAQIASEADTPADRAMWIRQMADMISASVQSGAYPAGVERLAVLLKSLQANAGDRDLAAYVQFRLLNAAYGQSLQASNPDFAKIQSAWLENLKQFAEDYPANPDTAEALLQLAVAEEFAGQEEAATDWYSQVVKHFPEIPAAKKAAGAIRRLTSEGKTITLQGKSPSGSVIDLATYRGKVVLLQYWATWSESSKTDIVILKDLVAKHGSSGFTVVGVSVDNSARALSNYLTTTHLPWEQIFEEGGLDSRPANELGIVTVPTMILLDKEGRVVNRNAQVGTLDREVRQLTQ